MKILFGMLLGYTLSDHPAIILAVGCIVLGLCIGFSIGSVESD